MAEENRHRKIEEIGREECLALLANKSFVGRIAFISEGRPMILPVNYIAEGGAIAFCTAHGSTLGEIADGTSVAFEVDSSRPRSGWSVVVHGVTSAVSDPLELERLTRGPLESWAAPVSEQWVRISIDEISGRRIIEEE